MMLRVALFACVAIAFAAAAEFTEEASALYKSLLPNAEKPMFITNKENMEEAFYVLKRGESKALSFEVKKGNEQMEFRYNNQLYHLEKFRFEFGESDTEIVIKFKEVPMDKGEVTPMRFKAKVYTGSASGVAVGIEPLAAHKVDFLLGSKDKSVKETNLEMGWLVKYLSQQRPMFSRVTRSPTTIEFVCPPLVMNQVVYDKLYELRNNMQTTITEKAKIQAKSRYARGSAMAASGADD